MRHEFEKILGEELRYHITVDLHGHRGFHGELPFLATIKIDGFVFRCNQDQMFELSLFIDMLKRIQAIHDSQNGLVDAILGILGIMQSCELFTNILYHIFIKMSIMYKKIAF